MALGGRAWVSAALENPDETDAPDETRPLVPFVLAAGGRDMLISCPGADESPPPSSGVGSPPGGTTTPPAPPLVSPPGANGGVPLCSGDVDGAGLPTLGAPPELWVGPGVGAGDGTDVELGTVGGGTATGGVPLDCPPGIGVFVDGDVGVQLWSGEDAGSLGVDGGAEDPDSVTVGCSLGVGSTVSDEVGVGDGSLAEGAGSKLDDGGAGGVDGALVMGGSVDEGGAVVEGCVEDCVEGSGVDDGGALAEVAGREGFVGGRYTDVPAGFDGRLFDLELGGRAGELGELSDVVPDVGAGSG